MSYAYKSIFASRTITCALYLLSPRLSPPRCRSSTLEANPIPLDEPRTAFDPASRSPSNPAVESGSPPPSGKRQIGESRGEATWRHPRQVKEWFAHTDDRKADIMMSSSIIRVTKRNVETYAVLCPTLWLWMTGLRRRQGGRFPGASHLHQRPSGIRGNRQPHAPRMGARGCSFA